MSTLAEIFDKLAEMTERYEGFAGEEFCALVDGMGFLRDAMRESEDNEKTEEADKEEKDTKDDIIACAWRVEYDLMRFVG